MASILDNLLHKLALQDATRKFKRATVLENLLQQAVIVRAQNIADYLYGATGQETWERREHFPCVAPPWKLSWMEWRHPRYSNSEGKIVDRGASPDVGVLLGAVDLEAMKVRNIVPDAQGRIESTVRWMLAMDFYADLGIRNRDGIEEVELGTTCYFIDTNGVLIESQDRALEQMAAEFTGQEALDYGQPFARNSYITPFTPAGIFGTDPDIMQAINLTVRALETVVFLAWSFCHCKNVRIERTDIPKEVIKKRKKSGKVVVPRFTTIKIDAMEKVLKQMGSHKSGGGLQRALHIARGHFKTYTADAPLLGKHVGTWYWPMIAKGSKKHGEVIKDYDVGPKKKG